MNRGGDFSTIYKGIILLRMLTPTQSSVVSGRQFPRKTSCGRFLESFLFSRMSSEALSVLCFPFRETSERESSTTKSSENPRFLT